MNKKSQGLTTATAIFWQVLSCVFAFFTCSFVTGLEALFCSLAAAFATAMLLSGRGLLSLLSTAAGALLGYAFALWSENGGVVYWSIDAPMFTNTVELTTDLRVLGGFWMLCLAGMIAASVYVLRKGYARTVCVAVNTFLLVAFQTAGVAWTLWVKYGALSPELIREKLALLADSIGNFLAYGLTSATVSVLPDESRTLYALGSSLVYTLPLVFLVACGVLAFFHSFLLKRLLRKSGVFTEKTAFIYFPSLTSALVYVMITVAAFFVGAFDESGSAAYGLELLDGFLSWIFFVPGLSALRLLLDRRKGTARPFPWLIVVAVLVIFPVLLGLAMNLIPTVGLVFVISVGLRKRAAEKQNLK